MNFLKYINISLLKNLISDIFIRFSKKNITSSTLSLSFS